SAADQSTRTPCRSEHRGDVIGPDPGYSARPQAPGDALPAGTFGGRGPMEMMSMVPDQALARMVVEEGIRQYFAATRERIEPSVDRHFSLPGSLRLHRAAPGWD